MLMELAENDITLKRRLWPEVAGPEQVAAEVRKRLSTIARAHAYVEWNRTRPLVRDLETQ